MSKNEDHPAFQLAKDPGASADELMQLLELDNEALNASIAMNPSSPRALLERLSQNPSSEVQSALSKRYTGYPDLESIRMRQIDLADADYIFSLRTDDRYNTHLSKVSNELSQQEDYIKTYLSDTLTKRDSFYFIIENTLKNIRCGTVRLYNFKGNSFEWGSWILDENKPRYAAIETAIFVYEFGFHNLGFQMSEFEVRKNNERVVQYHLKSGAEIVSEDAENFYFRITKETGLGFASDLREKMLK